MRATNDLGWRTRTARRLVVSGLVGSCLLGSTSSAWADPPGPDALPVAIVAIKSDDALDQAEALTQVLRKAVRDAKGWSLEEDKQHSLEFLALQMKCKEPIDAACEARIAEVIKSDRYVWGVIQLSGDTVTGALNFFVRGKGTSRHELRYSANLTEPTDDSLISLAKEAFDEVTGGPPVGGLRVSTGGIAGQLYVDDAPIGALDAEGGTFQLPSGEHRVVVKAPGYADAEATVVVRPSTTVDTSLTMVAAEEETSVDGRVIGGIVSLAVGVGAGAVGLWAALEVNSLGNDAGYDAYRKGTPASTETCDYAQSDDNVVSTPPGASSPADVRDACDTASTMEIVQAVMFPTAAVALGLAGFLFGTSSLVGGSDGEADAAEEGEAAEPEETSWSLEPYVSPSLQWVQFSYRF